MGETPRKAPNHLNAWARSSDVRGLLRGCQLEWAGTLLAHDEQKRDNINFALGTAFHTIPEEVLAGGMDIESAIENSIHVLDAEIAGFGDNPISGKRSVNPNILARNLDRMGRTWYEDVVLSGRFAGFDVAVEYDVVIENQLYTQLDAWYSTTDGDGEHAIVDWKSGTSRRSDSLQLWVYEYGLRTNGTISEDETVTGWFYHAWDGHWQQADPYPGNAVIAVMLNETFERKSKLTSQLPVAIPDWYCDYCAIQDSLCPAFNNGSWEKVAALWEERRPVLVDKKGNPIG